MENQWQVFSYEESYKKLNNTMEVKLNSGKTVSIWNMIGSSAFDKNAEKIDSLSVLFFRQKKNYERFNRLQKHYETLKKLDQCFEGDIIDDIDWAITDTLKIQFGEEEDLKKAFETIRSYIEKAQNVILKESKEYL